jgi:hypothetical protein
MRKKYNLRLQILVTMLAADVNGAPWPKPRRAAGNERSLVQIVFLRCWIIMYWSKVFSDSWNQR